jgi:nucleotide-binding universal stress UspA family protein
LLGWVAEKIFRQAHCPVLTVGPNVQPSFPLTAQTRRSVLFATDFSPQAEHAFPYAFSFAQEHQARLVPARGATNGSEATFNKDRALRYRSVRLRELMARAAELAQEPEFMVETGDTAEAIVKVAAESRAEVVVLGVRGPARLSDRIGWSTACGVVREAHCPVLTVRSPELL